LLWISPKLLNLSQRRRQWGAAPLHKICPPLARGLARHNKRITIEEIIKVVATRCQILRLKCTKSFTALPRLPNWLLGGLLLRERGRDERGRESGRGRGGKGKEGGRGRVGPKPKPWSPELFSWRRR